MQTSAATVFHTSVKSGQQFLRRIAFVDERSGACCKCRWTKAQSLAENDQTQIGRSLQNTLRKIIFCKSGGSPTQEHNIGADLRHEDEKLAAIVDLTNDAYVGPPTQHHAEGKARPVLAICHNDANVLAWWLLFVHWLSIYPGTNRLFFSVVPKGCWQYTVKSRW